MSKNFWDKKARLRKNIQLKNRNILVIERMIDDKLALREDEAIELLLEDKNLYEEIIKKLKEDYPDIEE